MLERLALAGQPSIELVTQRVIANGMSLRTHWNRGIALKMIRSRQWDYVVLHDQSTMGFKNPALLKEYVSKFDAECKTNGARTALYLTRARKHTPERQLEITAAYEEAASTIGALVIPVGIAWQRALKMQPKLRLHTWDRSHPTPAGPYLAASVFYAKLIGVTPLGLPAEKLSGDEAAPLQRLASEVYSEHHG